MKKTWVNEYGIVLSMDSPDEPTADLHELRPLVRNACLAECGGDVTAAEQATSIIMAMSDDTIRTVALAELDRATPDDDFDDDYDFDDDAALWEGYDLRGREGMEAALSVLDAALSQMNATEAALAILDVDH